MTSERSRSNTDEATDSPVGRVLREEFRIDAPLGSGGMSKVYRARQLSVDRDVVVKIMSPPEHRYEEWRARFLQEARAASRVNHPGIVTIYSFGEEDGVGPFIAMEYVGGVGLRKLLAAVKRFEPLRACRLMSRVCRAMHEAHEAGVVHRDLKPDNIMIETRDDREVPRVLDFGVAKPSDAMVNTLDSEVVGTPDYMAPEQARKNPVDARTDVYSAGIILYELLFGKRPFYAPEPLQLMFKHVNEPLPVDEWERDWPVGLRDVLLKACAKDPDDRYQSAREMALALEAIVEEASAATSEASLEEDVRVSSEMVAPVATPGPSESAHHSEPEVDEPAEATSFPDLKTEVHTPSVSLPPEPESEPSAPELHPNGDSAATSDGNRVPWWIFGALLVVPLVLATVFVSLWSSDEEQARDEPNVAIEPPDEPSSPGAAETPEVAVDELPGREPPETPPAHASTSTRASNRVAAAVAQAAGASDYAAEAQRRQAATRQTSPVGEPSRARADEREEEDGFGLVEVPEEERPEVMEVQFEDEQ